MNNLSEKRVEELKEKIQKTKDVYKDLFERFDPADVRIIWSAGKDSTMTLWILKQYCEETGTPMPTCFTIDEFDVFEEIDAMLKVYAEAWDFRLDWGLNIDLVKAASWKLDQDVTVSDLNERNRMEIDRIGFEGLEMFPFEAESFIGNHLMKTVVINQYLEHCKAKAIVQGLRWDEHPARKDDLYSDYFAGDEYTPAHHRFRPILHFTERDIWDATLHFGVPHCELYAKGYRSLGAKTTSLKISDEPAWEQDLENTEERGRQASGQGKNHGKASCSWLYVIYKSICRCTCKAINLRGWDWNE